MADKASMAVHILSACAVAVEINSNFQYQVNGKITPKNDCDVSGDYESGRYTLHLLPIYLYIYIYILDESKLVMRFIYGR